MRQTTRTLRALGGAGVLLGMSLLLPAGCNLRPSGPKTTAGKKVRSVAVNPADPAEGEAAKKLLAAEMRYGHALKTLRAYYVKVGAYDKRECADRELENLEKARTWEFEGAARAPEPPAEPVEDVTEAALVEHMLSARADWKAALAGLADHYHGKGFNFKLALIRNVQRRFDPVREYSYFLHAEIPPPTLKPREFIQAADDLFENALRIHRRGKPLPGITSYPKQRKALGMFRQLVYKYPTSTKIARSAYYIGEIYKEYFKGEDARAVQWYERAWQWDANIRLPARSQAAFVYDFRMHHRGKALELYREVIKHEQFAPDRVRYAYQRIGELEQKTQ